MSKTQSFDFLTVNSGHAVVSHATHVDAHAIKQLKPLVKSAGGALPMEEGYSVAITLHKGMAEFQIANQKTPLVQSYLVWDRNKTSEAWKATVHRFTAEYGKAAYLPRQRKPEGASWLAVILLPELFKPRYVNATRWLGDCERCLAWTILAYAQEKEAREKEDDITQPLHDLLQTLDMFDTAGSNTPVALKKNKGFDTFPALVAGILDTTQLLQAQGDSIYSGAYSENLGECTFEFVTVQARWLIRKAPLECSADIKKLLRQLAPQKLQALGTEYNPYFMLDAHLVPGFLELCRTRHA